MKMLLSKCLSKNFFKSTLITSLSSLEIDIRLSSEIPKGMMSSFDDFSILPRNTSASLSPSPQTPPSRRPMTELINHTIHVILLHSIPSLFFSFSDKPAVSVYYLHFLEHVKLRETCTIYIIDLLKLEIHVNSLSKCLSSFFSNRRL